MPSMDQVDAVVIGAGVVGLATARAFARRGFETLVLERAAAIGSGTSSRNSEVIHAGLYYPTGSAKARLCVAGRRQLYAHCEQHGVEHRRCGKLVVATSAAQEAALQALAAQAIANGVDDLQWLDGEEARALEPELRCVRAVWSPSTGIIDSHGLMLSLQAGLEHAGGAVVLSTPVQSVQADGDGLVVHAGGDAPSSLRARIVVNAAGLWAPEVAACIEGLPARHVPEPRFAKGNYASLAGRAPFTRLVYPMPEEGGLGVHLTLDLAGQARFGPDVEWIEPRSADDIDYRVDPARGAAFYEEIRRYWPALPDGALQPAYSGVRPKLRLPPGTVQDFVVQGPREHGVRGLVNLFGIESPGLTACLALAAAAVDAVAA